MRPSSRSTPGWKRSRSAGWVRLNSTLTSQGLPGSYGGTAFRSASAVFAPSSISFRARNGGICRADPELSARFTATVVRPSPSSAFPSRQEASSPVTSSTGQPHVPQSAALIPVSPTSVPLNQSR